MIRVIFIFEILLFKSYCLKNCDLKLVQQLLAQLPRQQLQRLQRLRQRQRRLQLLLLQQQLLLVLVQQALVLLLLLLHNMLAKLANTIMSKITVFTTMSVILLIGQFRLRVTFSQLFGSAASFTENFSLTQTHCINLKLILFNLSHVIQICFVYKYLINFLQSFFCNNFNFKQNFRGKT